MKKLLFLLTFLPMVTFGQKFSISGYVRDFTTFNALANVTVHIYDSAGTSVQTQTNANGYFEDSTITIGASGTTISVWIDPCEPGLLSDRNFISYTIPPPTGSVSRTVSFQQCNTGCDIWVGFYHGSNFYYFQATTYDKSTNRNYTFYDGSTYTGTNHFANDTIILPNPKPGLFSYCVTWGNNCQKCDSAFLAFSCNAEYYVDTVNSFGGSVILWNTSTTVTSNATYHWDFGDGNTSTDPYPFHQYAAPGTYAVCLTVTDSICTSTYCDTLGMDANGNLIYKGTNTGFSLRVLNPNTIGVEENHLSGLSIYPNPAKDVLNISGDFLTEKSTQIEIMDMTGRTVARYGGEAVASGRLEVSHLPRGLYIINITNKTNRESRKLLLD